MRKLLSRRDFLKLSGTVSLGLALSPYATTGLLIQASLASPTANSYPVIFNEDFEDVASAVARWSPQANYIFTTGRTGQGVLIESVSGADINITTPISVASIKGGAIALAASIKAENVSHPSNSSNGIKVMLRVILDDGTSLWPQIVVGTGTFDWVSKSVLIDVPVTATSATLYLGLEQCSGRVWFDDVVISILKGPSSFPAARDSSIPIEKYHAVPALRGVMVAYVISQSDMQVLGREWKANLVRWSLGWDLYPNGLLTTNYDFVLEQELILLDKALAWCRAYGLLVIVDLHSLSQGCFKSVATQNRLVETWKKIATRYKNNDIVWAYDPVNEPNPYDHEGMWGSDGVLIWEELADRIVREIRLIDYTKPIIIESPFGEPWTFGDLRPLDFSIPHIIYSAHMYNPAAFTLQTIINNNQYVYPGIIDGVLWNKNRLIHALQPVKDFQDKYRVPILIGEFSAIRWAPSNSAFYYLKDCIEIFESYGWDWCFLAFRGWDGFSVEHSEDRNDPNPTPVPNERQLLLRSYFGQNIKPTVSSQVYMPFIAR